jgi:predicted tellurium resistance membrane protein TerC
MTRFLIEVYYMDVSYITHILASLFTLTLLEIVLGVDNLVFIAIASNRLPLAKQKMARRFGLLLAAVTRLMFLASVLWIAHISIVLFTLYNLDFSVRDILLISGGLFLLYKGTLQIHAETEPESEQKIKHHYENVPSVILQIGIMDIVFSIDSVFTAVGLTSQYWIMASAIVIAILAMIFASEPLSRFIDRKPTVKILALSFILLIGTLLIADGFHVHVPRNYVYFAICYALAVELLNNWVHHRKTKGARF